jgi:hypothetical protein
MMVYDVYKIPLHPPFPKGEIALYSLFGKEGRGEILLNTHSVVVTLSKNNMNMMKSMKRDFDI